jgi:hypothetical protein
MTSHRVSLAWFIAASFAVAVFVVAPLGMEAHRLLQSEDDPAAIADRALKSAFDKSVAVREIDAALAANDADLAKSYLDLATDRGIEIPKEMAERVNKAVEYANSTAAHAESFARGLLTGEPDNMVSLAGTTLGDLFVFGDIRDATREGTRYATGEKVDELVLGLSLVGIAVTAGTYVSFGAAAPARVGLSVVKAARHTAKLSGRMAEWIGRSLREVIDWSALKRAGAASLSEPATAVRIARESVKAEKAGELMKLAGDVGRVQTRAGTQAALEGLKIAEGPRDMARVAALAEKKGSKTRAILKTLGRGAIFLSVASFNLAAWILGAILTLFGFASSAKSCAERMTQRGLDRRRARERERYLAMVSARA